MKFLEKYTKEIGKGRHHLVYKYDKEWVIKRPILRTEFGLQQFHKHIKIMKENPNIFPKVEVINNNTAKIEKLYLNNIIEELKHIKDMNFIPWIKKSGYSLDILNMLITVLHDETIYREKLNNDDIICQKWYSFYKEVEKLEKDIGEYVDLNIDNIGSDKYKNIKLMDF